MATGPPTTGLAGQEVPGAPVAACSWAAALELTAQSRGKQEAFFFEGPEWSSSLTYQEWEEASSLCAAGLAALGIGRGDRVACLAPGGPLWPVLETACSHLAAVLVPVNVRYRRDELAFVLATARPKVIFAIDRLRDIDYPGLLFEVAPAHLAITVVSFVSPAVRFTDSSDDWEVGQPLNTLAAFLGMAARHRVPTVAGRPDDPVLLQFTSGTTAFPKGALLSSRASLGATFHLSERMGLSASDRFLSTQPFYHVGGSIATALPPLTHGCTMVVPEHYQPEEIFRLAAKYSCTARTGQAAMYAMELQHPAFDGGAFAEMRRGWAAGTVNLKRLIAERMGIDELISTYGLTETAGTATAAHHDGDETERLVTCGPALPGVMVAARAETGELLSPGEVGEVCVKGWPLMLGYYQDPEGTAAVLGNDGWFRTGDSGFVDDDGNLYFVDRIKDMIKPGGENVSAFEVERVIAEMAGVAQVAVVGMADARLGEVPVAFVEAQAGHDLTEDDVISYCRPRMASFKVPRRVFFQHEWPLTESGKVQKHVLRGRLAAPPDGLVGQSG